MIWRLEYENAHGDVARLDIQRGAATPVEIIEGTENPFLLSYELEDKSKKGFIMSSFADISLYETATFNIDDLKTLDETALSVKWYINSVLEWTGFVVPDFFSRTIGEPAIVNLAASDRLSSLEDATLDGLSEYVKLKDLAIACLAKTGLSLPLITTVDFKADTTNIMDVFALSERLEDDKGKKISCFDTLRSILVLTNSTIRQRKGQWRIYNKIQHEAVAPTLNFDEVYQGAKRTIQPVFSSVGAFQEFGGTKGLPRNNTFSNSAAGWVAENGFVTEFDNRELNYTSPYFAPTFGDETNKINLINRNIWSDGSFDTVKKLSSSPFKVPFRGANSVAFTLEINARGMPNQSFRYALVKRLDGVPVSFMRNDGTWSPNFGGLVSFFPPKEDEAPFSSVDAIATIKSDVYLEESEDPEKVTLTVHILGVNSFTPPVGAPVIFASAIRSAKVEFDEKNDNGKGILYRTDQLGSFSKKSDPGTTIFGDYISSGLNGYFYPYAKDDKSILRSPLGSNLPLSKWTTATDPTAGELPILQHVTRQMSRMFSVAHNVLSAVIDAKTFDPLAIVTNCAGEKYVIVYSVFDFLRSTVEVELQQIAYGSLQRRDFIFSYFGGGDGDGISSIGSVSGGGSSSSGGGSFLDKYFSFDEENNALVANVNLVSEKEIAAYFADGSIPSIFDNFPFATSAKVGGIKASSTYQNGIRINSSGFLEVDPSYADSGVSSWGDLTDRPTWLTPTTKAAFEAAHGHTWGQITSKPTTFPPAAHNHTPSQVGLGNVGNYSDYARKTQNETITGSWNLRGLTIRNSLEPTPASFVRVQDNGNTSDVRSYATMLIHGATKTSESLPWKQVNINNQYVGASALAIKNYGNYGVHSLEFLTSYGVTTTAGEHELKSVMHVNHLGDIYLDRNGIFGGNLTAKNGTFTGLKIGANDVATESWIQNTGTAYNSLRLGGVIASDYARKGQNETITGAWNFQQPLQAGGYRFGTGHESWADVSIRMATLRSVHIVSAGSGNNGFLRLDSANGINQFRVQENGFVGLGIVPTERLHVVGSGLFTGNLTAKNGTFTNNIGLGSGLITYDPINDTIRFNKTVVSDFDIVAFTDSGQSLPSIFDNLPKTSKTSFGVVKVGAGINVSGGVISLDIGSIAPQTLSFNGVDNKLSISGGNTVDLSGLTPDLTGYATENWVQLGFKPIAYQPTWGQITSKPTTFTPTAHNHIIGDITGLQGALDGKKPNFSENTAFNKNFGTAAGTVAQGNDSRINNGQTAYGWGNHASIDYARKTQNETITGAWTFANAAWGETLKMKRGTHIVRFSMSSDTSGFYISDNDGATYPFRIVNGNIGIMDTGTPTEKLHVAGNGLFETSNGHIQITPTGWRNPVRASINVVSKGDYPSELNLSHTHSGVAKGWQISAREGDAGELHFYSHVGSSYMMRASLDTNGNFLAEGNITAQGEITAYQSSDKRLKKNIKTIESAIDTINKLNPVSFNWNDKAIELNSAKDSDRVNYGVIAQEIERVLPDLVHNTNGFKSVDYIQLIGVLLGAVKELHNEIKELKKKKWQYYRQQT